MLIAQTIWVFYIHLTSISTHTTGSKEKSYPGKSWCISLCGKESEPRVGQGPWSHHRQELQQVFWIPGGSEKWVKSLTFMCNNCLFVPGRIYFHPHWLISFLFISVSDGSVFAKNAGFQIFLGQPSEFPLLQVYWNLFFALVFIHIWGSPSFPCTWTSTWCGSLRESCHHGWHSSK